MILRWLCLVLITLTTACCSLPSVKTEQIGQRQVDYALSEHNTTPVIFENGLGGDLGWWVNVYPEIAKDYTAFVYNRPSYGNSDPASTPRDGKHIVDELRSVLQSKGLKPPYVLVGHSLGGLYMQHFARRYPDEVKALVLVDSTHPAQFQGKGAWTNWPTWFRFGFKLLMSKEEKQEFNEINATGDTLMRLPTLAGKPVIVLSALKEMDNNDYEVAKDANEKRKDIARLYPGAKQVWVDSGHAMPIEKPDAVIKAIREVLSEK